MSPGIVDLLEPDILSREDGVVRIVFDVKPEFRIPVFRVVIPGLEGADHSPKFVPGSRARALSGSR